ncbi:hypothetical protein [Cellulomonas dongxiuzhuiae]|uniref:Uncharacterized protein n=1 Tax=Cellulomonas dongxiuzhuiae TaxID=2819979 RepID=A0ABX8GKR6_9CELL|nr:hypothetical protein [Cellulomonas dongxiuzhuiae]MBO3096354.1 hypothetical protein [Cellulomonas dongxiuzhuiae]QWC16767.1 hypothetical protein KKR89_03735 [Cellulomonas dongxiuzhuiae]
MLEPVIAHLDLPTTPDELAWSLTAESRQQRSLINIWATSPDPRIASAVANSTAGTLADGSVPRRRRASTHRRQTGRGARGRQVSRVTCGRGRAATA